MKLLGYLMIGCIVLAAIKAALAALLIVFAIGFVWAAVTRPKELAGLVVLLIAAGLIQNHGLAFLAVVGVAMIFGVWRKN